MNLGVGQHSGERPKRCSGFQWWLSFVTGGMLSGCIAALVFVDIPSGNRDILLGLTGTLAGAWLTTVNFEFGSSRSGQAKDDTISALSKG